MKKKIVKILSLILLTTLAVLYSFYFTNLYSYDEIWNYGFAKNILDGLVPYRDFNMIVPPLFPYLFSIVLAIFSEKLIVYHIFMALITVAITFMVSKKIGLYAILVYINLLIYSANGYNVMTLLLLFILLYFLDKKIKHKEIIIPLIISVMILTKQTLVLLVIPSLIYSKNKKKTFFVYLITGLLFLIYLVANNSIYQFFDYCILGMFEFTEKNTMSIPIYLIIEVILCLLLIYRLIKSKFQRKELFYILMYQIIAFPITDLSHFVLTYSSIIYLLFKNKEIQVPMKNVLFGGLLIINIFLLLVTNYTTTITVKDYLANYPEDNFLKGRLVPKITNDYLKSMEEHVAASEAEEVYVLGIYSYLVKLALDRPITKYDLINNGNMGYKGHEKYIEEIASTCQNKTCLFIVNDSELNPKYHNQTNIEILEYVTANYNKTYSSSVFGIYQNRK